MSFHNFCHSLATQVSNRLSSLIYERIQHILKKKCRFYVNKLTICFLIQLYIFHYLIKFWGLTFQALVRSKNHSTGIAPPSTNHVCSYSEVGVFFCFLHFLKMRNMNVKYHMPDTTRVLMFPFGQFRLGSNTFPAFFIDAHEALTSSQKLHRGLIFGLFIFFIIRIERKNKILCTTLALIPIHDSSKFMQLTWESCFLYDSIHHKYKCLYLHGNIYFSIRQPIITFLVVVLCAHWTSNVCQTPILCIAFVQYKKSIAHEMCSSTLSCWGFMIIFDKCSLTFLPLLGMYLLFAFLTLV